MATSPLKSVNADAPNARYRERSLWLAQLDEPLTPRAPIAGDVDCDIAIVGAGFTGLWTAYYLKERAPDLDVVVIEREIAGFGPSGRNGGWASGGLTGSPTVYRRAGGADAVRRALEESYRAVDEIGRVAAMEGIDCAYIKAGAVVLATSGPQLRRLTAEVASAEEAGTAGTAIRMLEPGEVEQYVRAGGVRGGAFLANCARIDPACLARGLALACERRGVTIYERSEATAVAPGLVRCRGGRVRADTVLRLCEAYTTEMRGQGLRYLPLYSLMIATEPLPASVWDELGWRDGLLISDRHHLFFYAQRTADGRIAIGGRGAPYRFRSPISAENERNGAVRERLTEALRRTFPPAASARITHHWGGPLAAPRDWSMAISFDPSRRFGTAGGYTGHGVGAANISGRTLADLVLGRDSELVRLPWVAHRSRRWEPEPIRFVASQAIMRLLGNADAREDATDTRSRRTRLLKPFMPPH